MRMVAGHEAVAAVERLAARAAHRAAIEPRVRRIVNEVRRGGDKALRKYAQKWDAVRPRQLLRVPEEEMAAAWKALAPELKGALRVASQNIRRFCEWQRPRTRRQTRQGFSLGQIVQPLQSVGCYIPGGRYPLVSTVLMTVIPAQVAGVEAIRIVSPKPSREVLGAAAMLGATEFYRVGGAQAIAALAYGTESIPQVDKIVGPGNAYVTAAKKLVSFDCAIDFLAGPTEALIVSDSGNPEFIAADLVAQAEHDPEALAWFITTSQKQARWVARYVAQQSRENPTAKQSLRKGGTILIAPSRELAWEWANRIAAEHITVEPQDLPLVRSAGSIFVGDYSAQAAGDYGSGPNHVLPTSGQARFRGGLSVLDFVKIITVQELSAAGLKHIAPVIEWMARAEGLPAHANSIHLRCAHA